MALVAGVDASTQSTKVEVRDAESGRLVGHGWAPHPPTSPPRSEQDPEIWWRALGSARAEAGHVDDVATVSVAAQQHGLVVVDAADEVLRPAKLWNDTESAADADWLIGELPDGAAGWAAACGSVPVAAFTITKLSWLHRTEPEVFERIARVMLPHDWLAWKLTGELGTDRGDASGTGYWSAASGEYRLDLLEIVDRDLDWAAALPPVLDPGTAMGTGDNMAAALGLGLRAGDAAISLGTSGTVFSVSETPTADASGAVCGFADATGRYLPLVCTLNATKVTDATAHLLGVDLAELDEMALATAPGSGGIVFVPYLDGERTPNRPGTSGTISGLRSDCAREQLARSAFEGVVCGLLDGLDALRNVGAASDDGRLFLVGGGARSAAYRQILADLAQRPVVVTSEDELVALGACVQAAARESGTPIADVQDAWALGMGTTVDPGAGADAAAAVRAAYASAARLRLSGLSRAALAVPPDPALERGEDRVVVVRDPLVDVPLEPEPSHPRVEALVGLGEVDARPTGAEVDEPRVAVGSGPQRLADRVVAPRLVRLDLGEPLPRLPDAARERGTSVPGTCSGGPALRRSRRPGGGCRCGRPCALRPVRTPVPEHLPDLFDGSIQIQ